MAVHTCFPEANIEDLPMWAAAEIARGLTGPLRTQITATRPDDPALPTLREDLMNRDRGDTRRRRGRGGRRPCLRRSSCSDGQGGLWRREVLTYDDLSTR